MPLSKICTTFPTKKTKFYIGVNAYLMKFRHDSTYAGTPDNGPYINTILRSRVAYLVCVALTKNSHRISMNLKPANQIGLKLPPTLHQFYIWTSTLSHLCSGVAETWLSIWENKLTGCVNMYVMGLLYKLSDIMSHVWSITITITGVLKPFSGCI